MSTPTAQQLLELIKAFVFEKKFNKVYSKQYYYNIIYSMFNKIPEDQKLAFTFGDFNKLNQINKEHRTRKS